jgi:type VI secretion system protein ImpK
LAPPPYTPATAPAYQPHDQPPQPASSPYGLPPSRRSDEFGATSPGVEDWIQSQRPQDPNEPLQRAEDLHFEDLVAQNENPVMRAAGPLLLLLGRLRVAIVRASFASLMEQVAAAVNFFDRDIRSAGIPPEQANVAKYAICAMADDIVQNIPTEDRHVWTQYSMLSRFFGERIGGVRFFQELDRLKREPAVNYNLLELFHACLALGFQGMHRASAGGAGQLQLIQRDLYETLRRVRRRTALPLSPRWRGQEMPLKHSKLRVPLWAIAGISAFALLNLFLFLRTTLSHHADLAAQAMIDLHPARKVLLERRGPIVAPPPSPQVKNIVDAFKGDHDIVVNASGKWIVINVGAGILFESGKAMVLPQFQPIAQKIARIVENAPGPAKIVGHTDNQPLGPLNRFKNNQELSEERAKAVLAILAPMLSDANRVTVEGKGPDSPAANNGTPEGRAKNRRVEVYVTRAN